MKRLNRIAKRITALDKTIEQFINECEDSGKFNNYQMWEIRQGFKDGLTIDQVKLYVDPKFDSDQMCKIRWGFLEGLTMEQVKTFAKPEIDGNQMQKITKEMLKPFKMSFQNGGMNRNKAIEFIQYTNKPIKHTNGLTYRNPLTFLKPVSKDEAIEIIKKADLLDINEYKDYIDLHEYSYSDMY